MKLVFLVIAILINFFDHSLIKSEEEIDSGNNKIENNFVEKLKQCIVSFYGEDPIISENLSKLEKKQFSSTVKILKRYKKEKRILFGGTFSKKKLKISPTILKTKLDETDILQKELFNSLLPVISIKDKESA